MHQYQWALIFTYWNKNKREWDSLVNTIFNKIHVMSLCLKLLFLHHIDMVIHSVYFLGIHHIDILAVVIVKFWLIDFVHTSLVTVYLTIRIILRCNYFSFTLMFTIWFKQLLLINDFCFWFYFKQQNFYF